MTAAANPEVKVVIECPYCTRKMKIPVGRRIQVTCPDPACRKVFKYGSNPERKSFGKYVFPACMLIFICFAVYAGFEYRNKPDVQNHATEAYKPAPTSVGTTSDKYEPVKKLLEEGIAARQAGDFKTGCIRSQQALSLAQSDSRIPRNSVNDISELSIGWCQQSRPATDKLWADIFDRDCEKYGKARQVCAPAPDFESCMKLLGMSWLDRDVCHSR